ncbi:hypothetical protein LCGC14_0439530 [marine sediment metagenome]|uniref:Uncharacterized protein n=1 Tax=marine sediment metagenome TaxID=412755 RepID=A0A0F9SKZ8_9ZZZZ
MALKSYRLKDTIKKKTKRGKSGGFIRDATGAIIGLALFSEVSKAVGRI